MIPLRKPPGESQESRNIRNISRSSRIMAPNVELSKRKKEINTIQHLEVGRVFRENSDHQQMKLFSTLNDMHPRLKRKLEQSWAQVFYEHVFCQIDESQFAPLYCLITAGRTSRSTSCSAWKRSSTVQLHRRGDPRTVLVQLSDQLRRRHSHPGRVAVGAENILRVPGAGVPLHPGASRRGGPDLQAVRGAARAFPEITNTSAKEQRTDSTFIAPNIKRAGRLSLAYDVLVQAIKSIPEARTEH